MFIDNLIEKIKEKRNHSVVGLDPRIDFVPRYIRDKYSRKYSDKVKGETFAILEFNKIVIDTIKDIVPIVKPQIAFYESYGIDGLNIFRETVNYAKEKDLIIIADVKRGDIGSTAKGYARAYFGGGFVDVDSITVNPYLGKDSIIPFLEYCHIDKGIFVLAKTSNKSSADIQDLTIEDKRVYEVMAKYIDTWGKGFEGKYGYSSVGAVVGATFPEVMKELRRIMPRTYFLVPGYGAQGGTAKDVVDCFNSDGLGAVINSSRGIIGAHMKDEYKGKYEEKDFHLAIKDAAIKMRDEINFELNKAGKLFF